MKTKAPALDTYEDRVAFLRGEGFEQDDMGCWMDALGRRAVSDLMVQDTLVFRYALEHGLFGVELPLESRPEVNRET